METEAETEEPTLANTYTDEIKAELGLDGYEFNLYMRNVEGTWNNQDIYAEGTTRLIWRKKHTKENL